MAMPGSRSFRFAPLLLAIPALVSCNNDPAGSDTPYAVVPVTSTTLAGTPGWTLTDTLMAEVRDAEGNPVPGATVQWSLPNGGSLVVQSAQSDNGMVGRADDRGRNYAVWTLGLGEGTQVARVAAGFEEPATFSASATALHALSVTVGSPEFVNAEYVCAVQPDHRPVCWGDNRYGQLGTGDTLPRTVPVSPVGLGMVQEILGSDGGHTCARDMAGDVWCWGRNHRGQAGPGAAQPLQLVPVRVNGAEGALSLTVSPSPGYYTCAVLTAGGAKCWGRNGDGRLGNGDTISSATPRPVIGSDDFTKISAFEDRACAVTTSWEVWCWGKASFGELSPYPPGEYATPIQPVPGYAFSSVALNSFANCGIAIGGDVLCWGMSVKFATGVSNTRRLTEAPVRAYPGANFAELVSDGGVFYGRTRTGQMIYWGSAGGDNDQPPQALDMSIRAEQLAGSGRRYCVIAESGALYCDLTSDWFYEGRNHLQAIPAP